MKLTEAFISLFLLWALVLPAQSAAAPAAQRTIAAKVITARPATYILPEGLAKKKIMCLSKGARMVPGRIAAIKRKKVYWSSFSYLKKLARRGRSTKAALARRLRALSAEAGTALEKCRAHGDILPVIKPSVTQCVAPCGIFFDASETAGLSNSELVQSLVRWDFGDPDSGFWPTTGKSKNQATGFLAAHVYEQPGHYEVRLRLVDTTGKETSVAQSVEILAEPPGGWITYYVSSSQGSDSYDGRWPSAQGGNSGPWKTYEKAMNFIQGQPRGVSLNIKILFRREDRWEYSVFETVSISGKKGPVLVGAYYNADGSDDPTKARPLIKTVSTTGDGTRGLLSLITDTEDFRVMDLAFHGPYSTPAQGRPLGVTTSGARHILLYRLEVGYQGINLYVGNEYDSGGIHNGEYVIVAGSRLLTDAGSYHYGTAAGQWFKSAFLGNYHENGLRLFPSYTDERSGFTVLSQNYCTCGGGTPGGGGCLGCLRSVNGVNLVTDNVFNVEGATSVFTNKCESKPAAGTGDLCYGFGNDSNCTPCDNGDEHLDPEDDVFVVERNLFMNDKEPVYTSSALRLGSSRLAMARNNVFHNTYGAITIVVSTAPTVIGNRVTPLGKAWVLNNAHFSGRSDYLPEVVFLGVQQGSIAESLAVKNNIEAAPNMANGAGVSVVKMPAGIPTLDMSNNLWYAPKLAKPFVFDGLGMNFTGWTAAIPSEAGSFCGAAGICDGYDPLFLSTDLPSPNFLVPSPGSPAIDHGAPAPVFDDFYGAPRPVGVACDIGAIEVK